jgi:hypothetical protein
MGDSEMERLLSARLDTAGVRTRRDMFKRSGVVVQCRPMSALCCRGFLFDVDVQIWRGSRAQGSTRPVRDGAGIVAYHDL